MGYTCYDANYLNPTSSTSTNTSITEVCSYITCTTGYAGTVGAYSATCSGNGNPWTFSGVGCSGELMVTVINIDRALMNIIIAPTAPAHDYQNGPGEHTLNGSSLSRCWQPFITIQGLADYSNCMLMILKHIPSILPPTLTHSSNPFHHPTHTSGYNLSLTSMQLPAPSQPTHPASDAAAAVQRHR